MQILPSTTDNESGITGKGLKVFRSADWMKSIFTCMLPASFCPETLNDAYLFRSISGALIVAHILALQNQVPKAYEMSFKISFKVYRSFLSSRIRFTLSSDSKA